MHTNANPCLIFESIMKTAKDTLTKHKFQKSLEVLRQSMYSEFVRYLCYSIMMFDGDHYYKY